MFFPQEISKNELINFGYLATIFGFNFFFIFFLLMGGIVVAHGFVCFLVGGYVNHWVCVFWGWWMGDSLISLNLGKVQVLDYLYKV